MFGPEKPFRLLFMFYAPRGTTFNMPIACLSAYVREQIEPVEVTVIRIGAADYEPYCETYAQMAKAFKPDLIGISCMSQHWNPLNPYLHDLRQLMPEVPILMGGYQAILDPEKTLEHSSVNFVCVGDGEFPLVALIRRMREGTGEPINGLWESRPNGEMIRSGRVLTQNLREMPFPDYDVFDEISSFADSTFSLTGIHDAVVLPAMTGRGCPYTCTYCSNTTLLKYYKGEGSYLRKYDPEVLANELSRVCDRYHAQYIEFWDELFLFDVKYAREFLGYYKERVGLPFLILSRPEVMNEQLCYFLASAGCHTICFGLESGSETYRREHLGRRMTNAQLIDAAENSRKAGINRLTFNIIGAPFETKEDMLKTLEINKKIRPEFFYFFVYMPLKGTPLYEAAERAGVLLDNYTAPEYENEHLNRRWRLSLREHAISPQDFEEIALLMADFKTDNNRLAYAQAATVH